MDFKSELDEASRVVAGCVSQLPKIAVAARTLINSIAQGGCIYWCGNGGSAADAQHLAAELVGRYRINRPPLRSIALTTDSSIVTALGNDYGFETVFSRQLEGLARPGDVLVAISTSGNSVNVLRAIETANAMGVHTIALLGDVPESLIALASHQQILVPSRSTAHIQTAHITVGQMLCGAIEESAFSHAC